MARPRLLVDHLLRDLDDRREGLATAARPDWVDRLVGDAAELFEPLAEIARVGFECRPTESGWAVDLFLGATETIGGPADGRRTPTDFQFDVAGLIALFDDVDRLRFEAYPDAPAESNRPYHSAFVIVGTVEGQPCRTRILSVPPGHIGPGLSNDGRGAEPTPR